MKLLKSIYPQKFNNNLVLISFSTGLVFLLTPVAIGFAGVRSAIADVDTDINTDVLFRPPSTEEQPEDTEGAASRQNGKCSQDFLVVRQQNSLSDRLNLTAVVPDRNYGLTVVEHPTFWVYLPKTSARQAILSIKEEGNKPHWQQSVNLTGETGIIGIKLSNDAPALKIGKNYQWAVILVCNHRPNPNDPVVAAWIQRVDESSIIGKHQFASTGLEKAAWYARKGIWYDALDILIAEKSSLNNWNDIWVKYLQSGGLDKIAREPIIR